MELFLASLLFSLVCAVSSLSCYRCTPDASLTCSNTQITCSPQETHCASAAITTFTEGQTINLDASDCAAPTDCGIASVNFLLSRVTVNVQCCDTDYCNTAYPPAYNNSTPNGLVCCGAKDCQTTVQCLGIENTCLSASFQIGGVTEMVRGCTSSNVCTTSQSSQIPGITQVNCCVGNLCNHAKCITLNILLALLPIVVLKCIF